MKFTYLNLLIKPLLYSLFILCIFISGQLHAEVKASMSQKSYYQGDQITLTIESDVSGKANPDLSVLEQNFNVKGSSASSQISIINGRRSFKKTWNIELQAKSLGQFTIPPINVGNETTESIEINVQELPPEVKAETKKHIFIEATADIKDGEIYVQQQIPYTVKFYYDAAMRTGEIILPTIKDANIRIVGRERKSEIIRAEKKYVVVERRYVISPEKSGPLTIPPTRVQGKIAVTDANTAQARKRQNEFDLMNELLFDQSNDTVFTSPFDSFFSRRSIGPTRPFDVSSEPIQVNVLPVAPSFTGSAWLPAEEVKMQDSWATNPPTLKVGEPITRTIIMQVKGLASSQIPEIIIPKPAGIKVYPEQAEGETPNDGNTIYGIQRVNISYIPDKSGAIIIPEINVDWWDVNKKQQQTYTLSGWNLNIAAGAVDLSASDIEPEIMSDLNYEAETSTEEVLTDSPNYWGWKTITALLIGILTLLFSLTLVGKRFLNFPKQLLKKKDQTKIIDESALYNTLINACASNENQTAARLLIEYANLKSPEIKFQNLGVLSKNIEVGVEIIKELEASLYSPNIGDWNGKDLHQLLSRGLRFKQKSRTTENFGLAPLYPN